MKKNKKKNKQQQQQQRKAELVTSVIKIGICAFCLNT